MEALISQIGLPLIAVIVPLIVAGFKKLAPSIPKLALPVIAAVIGPVLDIGLSLLAGIDSSGVMGALAGLAGVGVRELKDQVGKALSEA